MSSLTEKELDVITKLTAVWHAYLELPNEHSDDQTEFRHLFHEMQRHVLARPGTREFNERISFGKIK